MKPLSDAAVRHLQEVVEQPDLSGTKYRLLEPIARGGMGTVYRAEDIELHREVALKVLNSPELSEEAARRMMAEARIIARLEHPGIVPVHDVGVLPDGRVFYAMKLVRGRRLDQHLEPATPLADRLRLFVKLCEAVAFAHSQGVIHRDLKPDNVMVGAFGEVLVMDWGVAKWIGEPPAVSAAGTAQPAGSGTLHGTVLGTPGYMAPEQARGEIEQVDQRSDVYALGAILVFLLGGAGARAIRAVAVKAMAADRPARYHDAGELAADVARFLDGLPVTAYREGILQRAARLASRHRTAIVLVAAYLIARALLIFFTAR